MQKRKETLVIRLLLIFILILPNLQLQPLNHAYPLIAGQPSQSSYPMGIADLGISPNGPYIRETNQWLGIVYVKSISAVNNMNNSCFKNTVSFQLNVVLNYEYDGKTYALWLQDVAFYNTLTHGLCFLDNIWNFSAPNAKISGVIGKGGISSSFYAYVDKGSYTNISPPFVIGLLINVTTNDKGEPVIYFWYNDGHGWVNFDTVTVLSQNSTNVYFLVDGYNRTPNGLYYDAALVIGGPYGGSTAQIINGTVLLQLFYWNGHNFQEVRNAYDVGYDTGETVKNANVKYCVNPFNGELYAEITAGKENPGMFLWDEDNTTQLTVYSPVSNGYIYIYNESIPYSEGVNEALKVPFVGGEATLTLYPMNYAILVYQNGEAVAEANIYAGAGNVSTNTTQFSVSLSKTQISLHANESYTLNATISAYGNVTINVISPSSVKTSFTQEVLYVQGKKTISLAVCPTENGVFNVIINVSLFPGFYEIEIVTLYVNVHEKLFVTFELNVIGNPLPQEPEINLTYPNGTTATLKLYNFETIAVPPGTTYVIQQVICEGDVRWATPTLVTGVIKENETVTVTYYEQYLVNFEYEGKWNLTPPNVTYQYFSQLETVTVPAEVWVNYNSTYCYSPIVTVGDERIVATDYKGVITSPGTVNVYYTLQYFVTIISPIPVYALISGENVSLTTGWYNAGEEIQIENLTYYPTAGERCIITSISPSETVVVTSPMIIKISTMEQFYVNISSPIPVYALVNGKNETLESGWYNENTSICVENIPYYLSSDVRYIITNVYPSRLIIVDLPLTITISVVKQYYVTVNSKVPLKVVIWSPFIPFDTTYLKSSWVDQGTAIYVFNYSYYVSNDVRYILTGINVSPFISPSIIIEIYNVTPLIVFVVDSPVTVNVSFIEQFYVNVSSPIPVYAFINGKNESLTSSWFNANTSIYIENLTYCLTKDVRYIIVSIQPSQEIIIVSPITIKINAVEQFYVAVNSSIPVHALINGTNETLKSNWYNAGTLIYIENLTYYLSQNVRCVIVGIQPSQRIVVSSPLTIVIHTVKQFLVTMRVNGTSTLFFWVNQGTTLHLKNYTYYVTKEERYLIVNASPQFFTVNSPMTVNVTAIEQFLVTINGISTWYNKGARITLTASVPIYETAEFIGTYNVSPGTTITVNSPITETLVLYPNYVFYATVIGMILVIAGVVVIFIRRK